MTQTEYVGLDDTVNNKSTVWSVNSLPMAAQTLRNRRRICAQWLGIGFQYLIAKMLFGIYLPSIPV